MTSAAELRHLAVIPDGAPRPLVDDVASVVAAKSFGQIDHINNQRTLSVVANVEGSDLGRAAGAIERAIAALGDPPRGVTVATRGQIEQMLSTLADLREGLLLTIAVILLLLAATFESARDSIVVVSTIPGLLVGVVLILFVTALHLISSRSLVR
jgi:multidrug efflux pump subunit AcrB